MYYKSGAKVCSLHQRWQIASASLNFMPTALKIMTDCIPNSATLTLFADLGSPEDTFLVSVRFALAYGTQQPADHFESGDSESFDENEFIAKKAEQRILYVCAGYPRENSCMAGWKEKVVNRLITLMEEQAIQDMPEDEQGKVRTSLHQLKEPNRIRTEATDVPFSALGKLFKESHKSAKPSSG